MGVSFEKDPDYLMFEPESHAHTQTHTPVPVGGSANANSNAHVLHDLSDYFRTPPEHTTLNDPEPSQIQKHIQAIDNHNQDLYKPNPVPIPIAVSSTENNDGAGLGNLVAVGDTNANITEKNASALVSMPSPVAVDVANDSNEVDKIIYTPHDVFRKPEHFESLAPQLTANINIGSSNKENPQPVPQFLSPSELSYLPATNWVNRESNRGEGAGNNDPRLAANNEELQRVPGIQGLAGIGGTPYVGSSFLQADDVMVVEPVLQKLGDSGSAGGGGDSDSSWQPVALALQTTSGSMTVSMKAKRSRVSRVGRFACPECHVVFRQTGNLRKHVAEIHQKSKPFRCNVCGNYFSRKHARDTHLKAVHHKLRPFECNLCFKRYKNRSDLNKHMRTVERKEKPHACPICNRAFGERGKLKRHMTIHEKRDPTLNSPAAPPALDENNIAITNTNNLNMNTNANMNNDNIDTSNNNTS